MSALVEVEWRLAGFPTRIPNRALSIFLINDVKVSATVVHRYPIVTIAGDAAEFCILVEGVSTSGVRDEREEVFVAQIVDPRPRCLRVGNHILTMFVIEMTIAFLFHIALFYLDYFIEVSRFNVCLVQPHPASGGHWYRCRTTRRSSNTNVRRSRRSSSRGKRLGHDRS